MLRDRDGASNIGTFACRTFPRDTKASKKTNKQTTNDQINNMKYITILSVVILVSCRTNNQKVEEKREPEPVDIKVQIAKEIKTLESFGPSNYKRNIFSLKTEVAVFLNLAILIEQAFQDKDPEIIKLSRLLNEKLEKIQANEFPAIRKRYIELLSTRLNLYDAIAKCAGNNCESLELYSTKFNSWDRTERQVRNMNSFQRSIKDEVRLFRFNYVSYQEKKHAMNSSAFRLKALYDTEVATPNSKPEATFDLALFERDLKRIKIQTENELNGITSHLRDNQFNGDISALKLLVANYFDIAIVVEEAINSEDSTTIEMGLLLKNKLKEIQKKEFSIIRKLYAKLVVNELLRYGANVKCLDNNCESLLLTSTDFDTKRIDPTHVSKRVDCHKKIEEYVKLFRFKLVMYGENEGSPNHVRYPIKSLDDDEIVLYKSSPEATFLE